MRPDRLAIELLSWNVAGRTKLLDEQIAAVRRRDADIVCLQEVRASTVGPWSEALSDEGLDEILDSSRFADGRRLFNLTASRWPMTELAPLGLPQPERVLSALVDSPAGLVELHNAHIPPAPSNGLVKVETCEALTNALARPAPGGRHRILCGDLNTPRRETPDGEVETFASNHPGDEQRWDAAERGLLVGLAEWDLPDIFRTLNGYDRDDVSWVMHTRARRKAAHRLDHVLASAALAAVRCDYEQGWREAGLSDHAAIEARFEPARVTGSAARSAGA